MSCVYTLLIGGECSILTVGYSPGTGGQEDNCQYGWWSTCMYASVLLKCSLFIDSLTLPHRKWRCLITLVCVGTLLTPPFSVRLTRKTGFTCSPGRSLLTLRGVYILVYFVLIFNYFAGYKIIVSRLY